jgi:hypothetical protein
MKEKLYKITCNQKHRKICRYQQQINPEAKNTDHPKNEEKIVQNYMQPKTPKNLLMKFTNFDR